MIVLLTDGINHHFTVVHSVNRIHEYLDLIDPWPDQIFLRRGLNRKRVEAKIVEVPKKGKLVRITRNEFDRVVLGAIGHENVSFHAHLAEVFGESRNNPRFLLALAIATLGPEPHESTESALPYLEEALNVARPKTGTALARRVALESLYVVHVTSYLLESGYVSESNRETVTHSLRRIVRIIRELFKDIQVESSLSEKQLVRLGQLALNANENRETEHIFSTVIQRFPNNPEGYFGRAMARHKLNKHNGTIEDVTRALPLREKLLASGAVPIELKEDSDIFEITGYLMSTHKRKHLHFMLTESYFIRGKAYNYLGKYEEAELDGRAAVEIKPNDPKGYFVTAVSLQERGLYWEAFPYFIKASICARKPVFTILFKAMAGKTLDSAKQHNPCRTLGLLESKSTPFVPILKDWAAAEVFFGEERVESDGEKLKRLSSCFVPNDTIAISTGEEHGEFIEVLIDRTLAGEQLINQGQQEHDFYCKGVVLKSMLQPIFDGGDQKE
jgi:tetratricopeptide (TPR) repeat protein